MKMNLKEFMSLSLAEQRLVEWQYEMSNASFSTKLFDVIAKADFENREKLRMGFPEEVAAYERFAHGDGWWQDIRKRLEIC